MTIHKSTICINGLSFELILYIVYAEWLKRIYEKYLSKYFNQNDYDIEDKLE